MCAGTMLHLLASALVSFSTRIGDGGDKHEWSGGCLDVEVTEEGGAQAKQQKPVSEWDRRAWALRITLSKHLSGGTRCEVLTKVLE